MSEMASVTMPASILTQDTAAKTMRMRFILFSLFHEKIEEGLDGDRILLPAPFLPESDVAGGVELDDDLATPGRREKVALDFAFECGHERTTL